MTRWLRRELSNPAKGSDPCGTAVGLSVMDCESRRIASLRFPPCHLESITGRRSSVGRAADS